MKAFYGEKNTDFVAVICEFDPFHSGHAYLLSALRKRFPDRRILCLMSGNFCQRGEVALLDKYTRAKEAIAGGADVVAELPVPFATASAERFALGAVHILAALPCVKTLAFGVECGTQEDFEGLALRLVRENSDLSAAIQTNLKTGLSFAAARARAIGEVYPDTDERLYTSPNNILALEYAKAKLRKGAAFDLYPVLRKGAAHSEGVRDGLSSATHIRRLIAEGKDPSPYLPAQTAQDLALCLTNADKARWDGILQYALLQRSRAEIARCPDCTEGLENALQKSAKEAFSAEEIVQKITSARYPSARIRRILLANALNVSEAQTAQFLKERLYLDLLAVRDEALLSVLSEGELPLLTRKGDEGRLFPTARACFACTERADEIYSMLCKRHVSPYYMAICRE